MLPLFASFLQDADITLGDDEFVSDEHAFIRSGSIADTIEVKDAGSTNGLKLKSVRIQKKKWFQVNIGDVLVFGLSKLELVVIHT